MFRTTTIITLLLAATAFAGQLAAQRTPDEALRALQDGNRRFASERPQQQPLGEGVRRTLARGESPFAIVVCCSDSQVPPEHLFNTGLGELYVVRTAGHTIDAETIAGLEHAVADLNVPLCVVLGHEGCTAIAQSIEQVLAPTQQRAESDAVQQLLEQIEPAVRKARHRDLGGKALQDACEEEHAHGTVADCLRRSAVLRRFAAVGKFKIVAARCHQQSGEVEFLPIRPLPAEPEAERKAPHGSVPTGTPPHVALRLLQAGHRRFLGDGKPTADLSQARRQALAEAQSPPVIVLTCADSRVVPEHLFDAGLGELVVIRSPGNTLTDNALASIEQAATTFGSSLLVVLGHEQCDVVLTATRAEGRTDLSASMRHLLQRIEPSVAKARASGAGRDVANRTTALHAERMVQEARSRSSILRELEASGRFAMLASVYDLKSGDITWVKDRAPGEPTARGGDDAHGEAHSGNGHEPAPTKPRTPKVAANDGHGKSKAKAAPKPRAAHDLPVVDWDAPAMPTGETATAHQAGGEGHGDGHAPAASHEQAPANHGHEEPGHEQPAHEQPGHPPQAAAGHGDAAAHGNSEHGQPDPHGGAAATPSHEAHEQEAHGDEPAPAADEHGAEPHADLGHGAEHGDAAAHEGNAAHEAEPAAVEHGEPAGHDADGEHGDHSHGEAAAHGDHGAAEPHGATEQHGAHADEGHHADSGHGHGGKPHHDVGWNDPIVLVGITGVVSLLAAAMLALRR